MEAKFRLRMRAWLLFAVSVVAIVVLAKDALIQMASWLVTRPEYSHGIAIPAISAFLIWQRRDQFERAPFTSAWSGLAIATLGTALCMIGKLSSIFTLQHYSVIIILYGLALSLTGWRAFRLLWLPLLVMLFMVPLPNFLYFNFSADLQLLSSAIGVAFMRLFGIPVFLEGNVIDLGAYKLQVAEACDGLRYLFPLMTIGFLIAYFFKAALWKRALVFFSSIPITILMNSFRVGTIGLMVEHWGVRMAEGFLHEFQGWAMFMLCAALLLGESMILAGVGDQRRPWRQVFGIEMPPPVARNRPTITRPIPASFYATVALLVIVASVSVLIPERMERAPSRTSLVQFPVTVADWTAHPETLEQIYLDTLKLDDYYLANFSSASSSPINLYIAWYDSQRAGRSAHSPRSCLPGGGWEIKSLRQMALPHVAIEGEPLRVNRVLIQLGNKRQLVYYWFQQRGRVITSEYAAKWFLFKDALLRDRTDGALVRLAIALPQGIDEASGDAALTRFAGQIAPILPSYIPH